MLLLWTSTSRSNCSNASLKNEASTRLQSLAQKGLEISHFKKANNLPTPLTNQTPQWRLLRHYPDFNMPRLIAFKC
jgi:hypothetical protein